MNPLGTVPVLLAEEETVTAGIKAIRKYLETRPSLAGQDIFKGTGTYGELYNVSSLQRVVEIRGQKVTAASNWWGDSKTFFFFTVSGSISDFVPFPIPTYIPSLCRYVLQTFFL